MGDSRLSWVQLIILTGFTRFFTPTGISVNLSSDVLAFIR